MKVLLINGSPHKSGNTFIALSEVAKTLESEGLEAEIVWIGDKPVRGCIVCGCCKAGKPYPDGHRGCVFTDDTCNTIADKFAESDAFIFGSPVYYGQPNGALLALMQRAFYSRGAELQNKPAAAVTVCRRGGGTAAFLALQMPIQMMNMPVVTSQYWNIVYGRDAGEAALDTEGMQTMRTLAHNMARVLRGIANEPVPEREPRQAMGFIH